jgi:glyoxylase-like metal-dependent hydrolase (beta-lactamase superfamily II)
MYELIQVGERTYYINSPAKMGLYRLDNDSVVLIDTGNDKDAGRKLQKIIEENGWRLHMIINTHSHADHIGGNNLLQQRLGAPAYCPGIDKAFAENPILEPSYLFGGYPVRELKNKFLFAAESRVSELVPDILPEGLEMIRLDGHSFSMAGIKTSDDVWFLADCVTNAQILEKYHIFYLYDLQGFLNTLDNVEELEGKLFIPSHSEPMEDIKPLVDLNRRKAMEIIDLLLNIVKESKCFEDILKDVFDNYELKMDFNQYVLVGSTIRSYLAYLKENGKIAVDFVDNKLLWKAS